MGELPQFRTETGQWDTVAEMEYLQVRALCGAALAEGLEQDQVVRLVQNYHQRLGALYAEAAQRPVAGDGLPE